MPARADHRTGKRSVGINLLNGVCAVSNHRGRGYFYVRFTACLIAGSLVACGLLVGEGTAAGAPGSSNLRGAENYDLAYTTPTSPTPTPTSPNNTSPPSISGSLTVGGTLTAAPGTWTNSPTRFSYQWVDCNTSGQDCTAIPGATGSADNIPSSDIGHTIRV